MKKKIQVIILLSFAMCTLLNQAYCSKPTKEFYQLKVYHLKDNEQVSQVDRFLKEAYLPALHRVGINKVGVFKPIANDTASLKMIYVFTPFSSLDQFNALPEKLEKDEAYKTSGKDYLEAAYNNAPYLRIESILLESFASKFPIPSIQSPVTDKVYELRSYEGATEKLHRNKIQMFTTGGEISLFKRLEFNAIFYSKVISGSHMPNLMYMTSFENMAARDAHWKTFSSDSEWKQLSAKPEYQNNVSHIDITLMHATDYSDI